MAPSQPRRSSRATKKVKYSEEALSDTEEPPSSTSGVSGGAQTQAPPAANYFATVPKVKNSVKSSKKRARPDDEDADFVPADDDAVDVVAAQTEPRALPAVKKLKKASTVWPDIPLWEDDRCRLLEMLPLEILDRVFGSYSGLSLSDYVALSGVCKAFRSKFTPAVWNALWRNFGMNPTEVITPTLYRGSAGFDSAADRIFSGLSVDDPCNKQDGKEFNNVASDAYERIIETQTLHTKDSFARATFPMSAATAKYKISNDHVKKLPHERALNRHHRDAPMMYIVLEPAVRRRALILHGGWSGHVAHLNKCADRSRRTQATREANGTTRPAAAAPASAVHYGHSYMVDGIIHIPFFI